MHIHSVTLQNFKAHGDRHIDFYPGVNAISGENGAGKTSILEAIAWTLFNHRGAYRKEDLIRNGSNSAQVRVAFVSNRDGRTYAVERCTAKGYTIYDPQLNQRLDYHNIEEEILPWLRQHLGVAPGTDLARLFANTIGVPQGTFTADFLKTAEERKKVFDSILKVEEYKQVNRDMLSLEKHAKAQTETLTADLERFEEELQGLEPAQERFATVQAEMAANEATLTQLTTELAALSQQREQLMTQAKQLEAAETELKTLAARREGKTQAIALLRQSLKTTQGKVRLCNEHCAAYDAYETTQAAVTVVQKALRQRKSLQKKRDQKQQAIASQQQTSAKLIAQLEQLERDAAELERVQPQVAQQEGLELEQKTLNAQLQQLQTAKATVTSLTKQRTKLQKQHQDLEQQIVTIQGLAATVATIPQLEQQRDRLQSQLSRIEAAQQFEAELRQLVEAGESERDRHQGQVQAAYAILQQIQDSVPLLSADSIAMAMEAVQAGVALNSELLTELRQILTDLAAQTEGDRLTRELKATRQQISKANQQKATYSTLADKQAEGDRLQAETIDLEAQLKNLQSQLEQDAPLQQQRAKLELAIAELDNPRGRVRRLQSQLAQRDTLSQQVKTARAIEQTLSDELAILDTQLQNFAEQEQELETLQEKLAQNQAGHRVYMQNQSALTDLPEQEAQLQEAIATAESLAAQEQNQQAERDRLATDFDPHRLQTIVARHDELQGQSARLQGALPAQRSLIAELEGTLKRLEEIARKRQETQETLKQRRKSLSFVRFARKAYKEAGPRITASYLNRISYEADRLFRELLNRPNVALEWTADYEILVKETQHTRRFINLSGGEQMCAALAVRLALLRVLADIDVAFFDEPTTNMDRQRRDSLAEAIANIRTFRQLFVISHDDTFEHITENVILLTRDANG